ncbi:TlpA family protein disulfide reductase [Psychroserpens sp. Hel_I_66]|uniref:TlpA family protein disulfide reductase n=1 Tax=Psychroserpens sp. Hel_I_66 TaxID=1250004 RepID=UPI0006473656|nr:TlpA disulfide reductase family protein [Psychroserpens sp. Hel_I_66]
MKKIIYLAFLAFCITNCEAQKEPKQFSTIALQENFVNLDGEKVSLKSILETYKGQTVLIDVWASWCRDCIVGFPDVKALQNEFTDIKYVFLSMDKSQKSWKNGIKKYDITGEHFFMPKGWDSVFSDFVGLDWVPRYMVIDSESNIKLFRAIKASDPKIKEHLK